MNNEPVWLRTDVTWPNVRQESVRDVTNRHVGDIFTLVAVVVEFDWRCSKLLVRSKVRERTQRIIKNNQSTSVMVAQLYTKWFLHIGCCQNQTILNYTHIVGSTSSCTKRLKLKQSTLSEEKNLPAEHAMA